MDAGKILSCLAGIVGQEYIIIQTKNNPLGWLPHEDKDGYPIDFDYSTRFTRPRGPFGDLVGPNGFRRDVPNVAYIGVGIQNLNLLLDATSVGIRAGRTPNGPFIGGIPTGGFTQILQPYTEIQKPTG